jgi:FkbM family methyltransferase
MKKNLIFDVGLHTGQDTAYYLKKGYSVLAIDADRDLVDRAREAFSEHVNSGQLTLVNCAVSDHEGEVEFNLSNNPEWNSLRKTISDRNNLFKGTVKVQARTLPGLMQEYGVPYYCKIDIEGYDLICLRTMEGLGTLPRFMSVETECTDESEVLSEEQALATLNQLHKLGYRRFKLVDQATSCILSPEVRFHRSVALILRIRRRIGTLLGVPVKTNREILSSRLGHQFSVGSTGPFGDDLQGKWLDYGTARQTLLFHRRFYFALECSVNFGFWRDWHAKL